MTKDGLLIRDAAFVFFFMRLRTSFVLMTQRERKNKLCFSKLTQTVFVDRAGTGQVVSGCDE